MTGIVPKYSSKTFVISSITGVRTSTRTRPRQRSLAVRTMTTKCESGSRENLSVGITMPTGAGNERSRREGNRQCVGGLPGRRLG